jgi:hypothetical protein
MRVLLTLLLATSATPALADAAGAFRDGKWPAVVVQGRQENTVDSLILAGRAQLNIAAFNTRDKAQAMALVAEAEKDFDAALAKAPGNAEAQLQKGVAIGYRAKLTKSPGLGKDSRRRFEAVRAANPQMAMAWAAVAGWHAGAVATLGSFMANAVLGAKAAEVDPGFQKAIRMEPANPVHRAYYAMVLLDLDKANAAKAAQALQGIGQLPASDGFEAMARQQGQVLANSLKAGDAAASQALARRLQAFGTLG